MSDDLLGHKLEDWLPQEPQMGPPLPKWLGLTWPWYKKEVPEVYTCPICGATFSTQEELNAHIAATHPTPLAYGCPYCDQSFATLKELIDHVAAAHQDKPPLGEITIHWE